MCETVTLSLDPSTLVFQRGEGTPLSVTASVTSNVRQTLIFKVSCSDPARYSVSPNIAMMAVEPHQHCRCLVTVSVRNWSAPSTQSDKFRVQIRRWRSPASDASREVLRAAFDEAGETIAKMDVVARVDPSFPHDRSSAVNQKSAELDRLRRMHSQILGKLAALQSAVAKRETQYEAGRRTKPAAAFDVSHSRLGYFAAAGLVFVAVLLARLLDFN